MIARLLPLWPLLLPALVVGLADRLLLWSGTAHPSPAFVEPARRFARDMDPTRPQLILIGSSRAERVTTDTLRRATAEANLPHQAWTLAVSGGGPASLWLSLRDTPAGTGLPQGSKVIYLVSPFEFNVLKIDELAGLPQGRQWLSDGPLNKKWHGLYEHSGLIQRLQSRTTLDPTPLVRLRDLLWTPILAPEDHDCPGAAHLPDYRLLPVHRAAFEDMAAALGPDLVVGYAPVGPRFAACDDKFGARTAMLDYLRDAQARFGFALEENPGRIAVLPEEEWHEDQGHVNSPAGRLTLARGVVRLAR